MSPLRPLPRDAHSAFRLRAALLSKPDDYFTHVFGGRTPSLVEKALWIEGQVQHITSLQSFANDLYVVVVERHDAFHRLSIQRHDRQPCREWKHLQQMKNELFGARHEAVELYPSEDRLVDTCNEYHLWVHADPSYRFPLGFQSGRCVVNQLTEAVESAAHFTTPSSTDRSVATC